MVKRKSWHLCSHQRGSGDVAVVDESVIGVFTAIHGVFLQRDRKHVVTVVDCMQLDFEVPETHVGGGDVPDRDGMVQWRCDGRNETGREAGGEKGGAWWW